MRLYYPILLRPCRHDDDYDGRLYRLLSICFQKRTSIFASEVSFAVSTFVSSLRRMLLVVVLLLLQVAANVEKNEHLSPSLGSQSYP